MYFLQDFEVRILNAKKAGIENFNTRKVKLDIIGNNKPRRFREDFAKNFVRQIHDLLKDAKIFIG